MKHAVNTGQTTTDHAVAHRDSVVHVFWAYGGLSTLEKLSVGSFLRHGFHVKLWTYEISPKLPATVEQCDARQVLPERRVFTYRNGSFAGFANLFRYAVLSRFGGFWADMDVICLSPASQVSQLGPAGFFVTGRTKAHGLRINNNVLYHPQPKNGDLIDLAQAVADRFDIAATQWGDCGPTLLTALVKAYPRMAPAIKAPECANPIDWWRCPQALLSDAGELPADATFLHCFNEMWRRAGIDKNARYPSGSIMAKMLDAYGEAF